MLPNTFVREPTLWNSLINKNRPNIKCASHLSENHTLVAIPQRGRLWEPYWCFPVLSNLSPTPLLTLLFFAVAIKHCKLQWYPRSSAALYPPNIQPEHTVWRRTWHLKYLSTFKHPLFERERLSMGWRADFFIHVLALLMHLFVASISIQVHTVFR